MSFEAALHSVALDVPHQSRVVAVGWAVEDLVSRFTRDPIRILVQEGELSLRGLRLIYQHIESKVWTLLAPEIFCGFT